MAKYFNEKRLIEIFKKSDWYIDFLDDFKKIMEQRGKANEMISREVKEEFYSFFERQLSLNKIRLGKSGPDYDKKRKPIDTIVIHHTKNEPGISLKRLNAIQLIKVYAVYYANPYYKETEHLRGQSIYSGHFRNNHQIFYTYHWLIRMDGSIERLLNDNEIGWHSGNWNINCRSIAICLDNDFTNSFPSDLVLSTIANLIKDNYPNIKSRNILGHREVNPKKICPGNRFLDDWKFKIIKLLED